MFNVYSYDRKLAQAESLVQMKQDFIQDELSRKKKQNKLVTNYKRRIENFVLQMSEKPIVRHEINLEKPKHRDEDPAKFLGPPKMIIRAFKHEKDRIQEAIERNKEYRGGFVSPPFEFRKRETGKEIQPQMRFMTKTRLEKLSERLTSLFQASVHASSGTKIPPKLDESLLQELSKSPQATNKFLAQHLLPEFNMKTHFRAAEGLYLALPLSHVDQKVKKPTPPNGQKPKSPRQSASRNETFKEIDTGDLSTKHGGLQLQKSSTLLMDDDRELEKKLTDKQAQIEVVDPSEASKDVLLKCNIIRSRKPNAYVLRKGEGHLIGISDLTLGEIYRDIYPDVVDLRASI